jgi:Rod binding domain-containing protein
MSSLTIPPLSLAQSSLPAGPRRSDDPAKLRDTGQQFEALLIGQILHTSHESGGGWLGTPEDAASDCATDFAEQQLASVMAQAGGFGIARMVERSLKA